MGGGGDGLPTWGKVTAMDLGEKKLGENVAPSEEWQGVTGG